MKIKFAALLVLGCFLMAMSSPVAAIDASGIKAKAKGFLTGALCTVCNTACAAVSDKCYAQFQEGTKGQDICAKIETGCYAKCPCPQE
jgi:hypothetical protein